LNGGLEAWRRRRSAAHPGKTRGTAARFTARPDTSRIAGFEYVHGCFGRPGHTIMDWRSTDDWEAGHIPHSLTFPLGDLLNDDGTIMDGPSMRPLFEGFGPRDREFVSLDDEFIVCGVGPGDKPAVHPYLAARLAGIERVRLYPEGFGGWKNHPQAPVVRIVPVAQVKNSLHDAWGKKLRDEPAPGLILLDLRGEREFATGHIPGAVWLPAHECEAKLDSVVARHWPRADRSRAPVIFYCYGPGCTRSRNCSTVAARHGFLNLQWFKEGTPAWTYSGEKLVSSR
jgi:3-mercaptopyruvate sulfurtransferase SseA